MRFGSFLTPPTAWPFADAKGSQTTLYHVALQWLKEDREHRKQLEASGQKKRGARSNDAVPTDSEVFYSKYVTISA